MPKKINKTAQEEFLRIFEKNSCLIRKSCKEIKIGKSTFYRWLKDSIFKDKVNKIKNKRKENCVKLRKIFADIKMHRKTIKFLNKYVHNEEY